MGDTNTSRILLSSSVSILFSKWWEITVGKGYTCGLAFLGIRAHCLTHAHTLTYIYTNMQRITLKQGSASSTARQAMCSDPKKGRAISTAFQMPTCIMPSLAFLGGAWTLMSKKISCGVFVTPRPHIRGVLIQGSMEELCPLMIFSRVCVQRT